MTSSSASVTEYTMYNMEIVTTPQGVQSWSTVSGCFAVKLVLIQNTVYKFRMLEEKIS